MSFTFNKTQSLRTIAPKGNAISQMQHGLVFDCEAYAASKIPRMGEADAVDLHDSALDDLLSLDLRHVE